MKIWLKSLVVLAWMLFSSAAIAWSCTTTTTSSAITPPAITIQRDLPVGSAIGSIITTSTIPVFNCTNSAPALTNQQFGVKGIGPYVTTINNRRVYSTGVTGIGYAVFGTSVGNCSGASGWVDGTANVDGNLNNRILCSVNGLFGNQPIQGQAGIQFYKTAQTTGSGTVSARQVASFILWNDQSSWFNPESTVNMSAFNVTTLACTVNNTAISVPMGTVEKRAFSGVGTWPGDASTKSFSIPLTCNAGTNVNLQIDGTAQNPTRGVLSLVGGSGSASGVGIQLLYNNNTLSIGNVLPIGTSTSGNYNILLQARYYQTADTVTPGTANAIATFTLTYQ